MCGLFTTSDYTISAARVGICPLCVQNSEHGLNLQFYAHPLPGQRVMNRELIRVATGYLGDLWSSGGRSFFGIVISVCPSPGGARVVGAEASSEAMAMAQRNTRLNGLEQRAGSLLGICIARRSG